MAMFRTLSLLAGTSLAASTLAGAAFAADLPERTAPPPMETFSPVPVFTWTGPYAGFNAGYGFGTGKDRGPTVLGIGPSTGVFGANPGRLAFTDTKSRDGFVGGGQIGYNWQLTPGSGFVVGVEADAQYVGFGRDRNRYFYNSPGSVAPGALVFNPNGLSSLDYFGTVRGRVGYAFDRTLVYGTGGFAYGSGGGRDFGLPGGNDKFQTGWAAGGGVEYALPTDSVFNFFNSSAVTLKVEGLYVSLDRNTGSGVFAQNSGGRLISTASPDVTVIRGGARANNTEFAVVRAGLNYKF